MKTKYLGNLLYGLFKELNRIEKDPQKIHDRMRAFLNFSRRIDQPLITNSLMGI